MANTEVMAAVLKLPAAGKLYADSKAAALFNAVTLRSIDAIKLLLKNGVDPTWKRDGQPSAIDVAAGSGFIPGLKLMDREGKHAHVIAEHAKRFPPQPKSRYLGGWDNGKDGFGQMIISLSADATGYVSFSLGTLPLFWEEMKGSELKLWVADEENGRLKELLSLQPSGREMLRKGDAESMRFHRVRQTER